MSTSPDRFSESEEVYAVEITPGQSSSVLEAWRRLPILEQHFLAEVSRLLNRDVWVLVADPSLSSQDFHVPGVLSVEGSAEHVFYLRERPLFPPAQENTTSGLETLSSDGIQEVLRPIPVRNIYQDLPLGAPGLFLGPVVPEISSGSWREILDHIQAPLAWERSRGQRSIIAIIDTGVDGSRFPQWQRLAGWSDLAGDNPYIDPVGHGSLVAMLAAASGWVEDFVGVAPEALIFPLRLRANSKGAMPTASILRAMERVLQLARERRQRIILNNSWGLFGCKQLLLPCGILITRVIRAADELNRFLSVWAIGNNKHVCAQAVTGYCMGTSPWSVSVGAVGRDLKPLFYSSSGGQCFPLSPTCVTPTYGELPWGSGFMDFGDQGAGTSSTTPMVSGALAILNSLYPRASNADLRAALRASARPLNPNRPYELYDPETGSGLLQIMDAIQAVPMARSHPSYAYERDFPTSVPGPE